MIKIYNSLTRKKEEFKPIKENEVSIYACGVTPYKPSHLGHAMQGIIFDVVRRYFEYKGYKATYVRNYTDIDDKIINKANEVEMNALDYVKKIIDQTDKEFDELRVRPADYSPKVTENIPEIIKMIQELIDKDFAYGTEEGNVYFRVKSFKEYGKLSGQKLDMLRVNTRKDNEPDKEDAIDFALWKAAKPGEVFWESPWGKGRPGWHIECSVMSLKHLGEAFDIHGGGGDLIFPHHENEIAQSEAAHNGKFATYWMHNGLLMVDGQKMSKSLNNDTSISEMLKIYHPEVIRYMIISNHYRSNINFVQSRYGEATENVRYVYETIKRAKENSQAKDDENDFEMHKKRFEEAMDDDLNTVEVVAQIQDYSREINKLIDKKEFNGKINSYLKFIHLVSQVIGQFDLEPSKVLKEITDRILIVKGKNPEEFESWMNEQILKRNDFKKEKNFAESDKIRTELEREGIELKDEGDKTIWTIKY